MHPALVLLFLLAIAGCDSSLASKRTVASDESANSSAPPPSGGGRTSTTVHWPEDSDAYQLGNLDSLRLPIPSCADVTAQFTSDSVGPLRPGQTLRDLVVRCPRVLPMWDWGDEGIPAPVVLVRLGAMVVRISLDDTLPTSPVTSVLSADSTARTREGVGPGSTVATLLATYGTPKYQEGECVVYATFPKMPRTSFRLDLLKKFDCGTLEGDDAKQWDAPPATRVTEMFIYPR